MGSIHFPARLAKAPRSSLARSSGLFCRQPVTKLAPCPVSKIPVATQAAKTTAHMSHTKSIVHSPFNATIQKSPRKSGAFYHGISVLLLDAPIPGHPFLSLCRLYLMRQRKLWQRRLAAYFLAMAATSAAKSSSLLARPSPFSKRTKFLMEMVPPSSLALASTYLETEVLFSLTKA